MSRKKDDKRVLIPRGKRQSGSMRKRRNDYNSMPVQPKRNDYFHSGGYGRNQPQRKTNGVLIAAVIIALIAFIIGAGIGVSLSLDNPSINDSPSVHYENVTGQMSNSNSNQSSTAVHFGEDLNNVNHNNVNKTVNASNSNSYYDG